MNIDEFVKNYIFGTKEYESNEGLLHFVETDIRDSIIYEIDDESLEDEKITIIENKVIARIKEELVEHGYEIYQGGSTYALDGKFVNVNGFDDDFVALNYALYEKCK